MRPTSQLRFWILLLAAFLGTFWLLRPVLLPFAAGVVIAYFLDPVVEIMARRRWPRWLSTFTVLAAFVVTIVLVLSLIAPVLRDQAAALMNAIPGYVTKFHSHVMPLIESWVSRFSPDIVAQLHESAAEYAGDFARMLGNGLKSIISGGIAFIDVVALAILTPIVAYYILRDWPLLTKVIDNNIPRRYYKIIRQEMAAIDSALSGFIRGQALMCIALGAYYTIGLTLTGVQYGLSIGVLSGVLSFIPYVGTAFAWVCSLALAAVQFDSMQPIVIVLIMLYVGHLLEAYVLAPRLIGHRVGLHPVWIFFSLLSGAKLLGFLGLLIAVPTAAVIGVLIRFGARQYRSSHLYKDAL